MRQRVGFVLAVIVVVTGGLIAGADERKPTPAPTPAPSATRTPVVITNETLSKYSGQGHVTEVSPAKPSPGGAGSDEPRRPFSWSAGNTAPGALHPIDSADAERNEAEQRAYWRGLYEQQLELVRSIKEQIDTLDTEIPGLWRDFYAWDDPMYRDGVIKPKLDEALERRQHLEERLGQEQERLPEILERARHAGGKPGWFRGLDQPTPPAKENGTDQPVKPEDLGGVAVVDPDKT